MNLHILHVQPVSGLSAEQILNIGGHTEKYVSALIDSTIANAFNASEPMKENLFFHIALVKGGLLNGNKLQGGEKLSQIKVPTTKADLNRFYMEGTAWSELKVNILPLIQEALKGELAKAPLKEKEHFILLLAFSQEQ